MVERYHLVLAAWAVGAGLLLAATTRFAPSFVQRRLVALAGLTGAVLGAWNDPRRWPWLVAAALVVAWSDDPTRPHPLEEWAAPLAVVSLVGVWSSVPDTEPALAAGAVLRAAGSAGSAGSADVALGLEVPGLHNLRNATGAYLAATAGLGVSPEAARAGLAGFSGVRRRFEARGHAGGVRVVDDYAHNPAKVAAVVSTAAGLIGDGRLVAVFQPHLYSRTRDFADAFGQALAAADVGVVLPVYAAREDPVPGVTGALVARAALAAGVTPLAG